MRKINFENHFTVDRDSSEPVYQQLVEAVLLATKTGLMDRGDRLPSINELSRVYAVSRSTIEKSYNNLRDMGILASQHGKSYYINRLDPAPELKVLVLFDQLNGYNKEIYDVLAEHLGYRAEIDFQVYHHSAVHLKHLLRKRQSGCSHIVLIPHFLDDPEAGEQCIARISDEKLILLGGQTTSRAVGMLCENYADVVPRALEELLPALRKYQRINLIDPGQLFGFQDAFQSFCATHNLVGRVLENSSRDLIRGEAYWTLSDEHLMQLVRQVNSLGWNAGKDIGMISYQENDAKKMLLNGITTISPDFKAIGKAVGDMVLTGHMQQVNQPWQVFLRGSL